MIAIVLMLSAGMEDAACIRVLPQMRKVVQMAGAGKLAEAEGLLQSLPEDSSGCAAAVVAAGRLELAKSNYDRANSLSERALSEAPSDPGALALRGQMLAMQGRAAEGREMLERAVALYAGDAEAWFQLGVIYDRAKLNDRAVAAFRNAARLRPNDPRAYDYLALNLEPLGRIAEADEAYKNGLAVNHAPLFDWFLDYNYGRLLLKLNRLPESKVHLDKAVELAPRLRATHYDHAKLNLRLGDLAGARGDAEKALEIADNRGLILDLQVYSLLAQIYARLGDQEMAKKYGALSENTPVPPRIEDRK